MARRQRKKPYKYKGGYKEDYGYSENYEGLKKTRKSYDNKLLDSIVIMAKTNMSQAMADIKKYKEIYPNDREALIIEAKLYTKLKNTAKSNEILQSISTFGNVLSKSEARAKFQTARNYLFDGRKEEAKEILKSLVYGKTYSGNEPKYMYSNMVAEEGKYAEAFKVIKSIDDRGPEYQINLARIYAFKGETKTAAKLLRNIDENELSSLQLYNLLVIYRTMEEYEKGLKLVEKLKNIYNEKETVYYKVLYIEASLYRAMFKPEKAIELLDNLMNSNNTNNIDDIYMEYGDCYALMCDYDEAKKNYLEGTHHIRNEHNKVLLEHRLALLDLMSGNIEEAIIRCELGIEQYKTEPKFYELLINIYLKNKEYDKADYYMSELVNNCNMYTEQDYRRRALALDKYFGRELSISGPYGYAEKQIINYDRDLALRHINVSRSTKEGTNFAKNINIEELYEEAKEKLTRENLCLTDGLNAYKIPHSEVGESSDYYIVVTDMVSDNIITMFPLVDNIGYQTPKDFAEKKNKLSQEKEKMKQKRLAKFAKFTD